MFSLPFFGATNNRTKCLSKNKTISQLYMQTTTHLYRKWHSYFQYEAMRPMLVEKVLHISTKRFLGSFSLKTYICNKIHLSEQPHCPTVRIQNVYGARILKMRHISPIFPQKWPTAFVCKNLLSHISKVYNLTYISS